VSSTGWRFAPFASAKWACLSSIVAVPVWQFSPSARKVGPARAGARLGLQLGDRPVYGDRCSGPPGPPPPTRRRSGQCGRAAGREVTFRYLNVLH